MIKKLSFVKLYLLVCFPLLITYSFNLKAFFQQDEWIAFGNILGMNSIKEYLTTALAPNVGHYVPFHYLYFGIFFKLFGISFIPWMISSIGFHLVITYLVGVIIFKLFNNKYYSLFTMMLFGFSASASQATTWAVADINTHGSTLFGFLSLLSFVNFLDDEKIRKRNLYLSLIFFFVSLLFKEVTIGFFVTVPLLAFVMERRLTLNRLSQQLKPWMSIGFGYLIFRVLPLLLLKTSSSDLITATQDKKLIIYNIATSPGKVFWQSILPSNFWYLVGQKLGYFPAKLIGFSPSTFQYDHFIQSRFLEGIFVFGFFLLVLFTLFSIRIFRNSFCLKLQIFGLSFVFINSLIYALSPGRSGIVTIIDGRNLYFCLLGTLIYLFASFELFSPIKYVKKLGILILLIVFVINCTYLFSDISSLIRIGEVRLSILNQAETYTTALKDKTVFFVESDTSYYGLPEKTHIPPFQSGFGQTLLVWYSQKKAFPKEIYSNYFLWPVDSQGYRESEGKGFGYFREYTDLLNFVKENQFPINNIISFSWESRPQALVNITDEIQSKLKKDVKKNN